MINKKIKKVLFYCLLITFFLITCFTEFWGNVWYLISYNAYFIPKESNIFTFKVTQMNEGSGEWWLYGEDSHYYYGLNIEPDVSFPYFIRSKGKETSSFDKFDYKTWKDN